MINFRPRPANLTFGRTCKSTGYSNITRLTPPSSGAVTDYIAELGVPADGASQSQRSTVILCPLYVT